jgi:hypothetical protein
LRGDRERLRRAWLSWLLALLCSRRVASTLLLLMGSVVVEFELLCLFAVLLLCLVRVWSLFALAGAELELLLALLGLGAELELLLAVALLLPLVWARLLSGLAGVELELLLVVLSLSAELELLLVVLGLIVLALCREVVDVLERLLSFLSLSWLARRLACSVAVRSAFSRLMTSFGFFGMCVLAGCSASGGVSSAVSSSSSSSSSSLFR